MRLVVFVIAGLCCWSTLAAADDSVTTTAAEEGFDWTGPYIGIYGAYGFGQAEAAGALDTKPRDPFVGVIGGYATEFEGLIFGLEGDVSLSDLDGYGGPGGTAVSDDIDNIAAVRGRIGVPLDRFQLFASAGWSWARTERSVVLGSDRETLSGLMLGVGLQARLGGNLVGRIEYTYQHYGKTVFDLPGSPKVDTNVSAVKAGLDFYF